MFFRKQTDKLNDGLLKATFDIKNEFAKALGEGWYLDVERQYQCRIASLEPCSINVHPAVVVMPRESITKPEFHMDSEGRSEMTPPSAAVFYGHYSDEIGMLTFYLHDFNSDFSVDPFFAYRNGIALASDNQTLDKSVDRIHSHFQKYLS
ncbi:hypothetical protein N8885_01960 [Aquiluna sp.]|nr:hypothetical protein [Aquiluna sp.]